jgi:hypothetical protein
MKHIPAIVFAILFSLIHEAAGCVGCRQPGSSGPVEPQTITAGIALSWGVLGMLAIVLMIVGGMTFYIISTCRQLDRVRNNP